MFKGRDWIFGAVMIIIYGIFYLGLAIAYIDFPEWTEQYTPYWAGALAVVLGANIVVGGWRAFTYVPILKWHTPWAFVGGMAMLAILFIPQYYNLDPISYLKIVAFFTVPFGVCIAMIWSGARRYDLSVSRTEQPLFPAR